MTITIPVALLALICAGVALFIIITAVVARNDGFRGDPTDGLFAVIAYLLGWALPMLAGWAVWATWFRGAA